MTISFSGASVLIMITFGAKLYLLQNVIVPGCQVTHPELVDEIYQQLGSGKTITESHAEWVRFNDGTQATTETLREMLIDTFQQSKIENGDVYQIIKVYLADLVLPGWKLDEIQTVHFANPFVSLLSGFSKEFLFGAPRGDKPEERNYQNIMKELFESRMRLAPATYDHFWVRKRWGHVYFRRMTYFGMICECLKHDLFEVVPSGGEAEMKREEGDRPLAWRYAEFEIPPSHSFFELEMPGIYKVRVRRPNAVNRNVRMDIASLGIPQEIGRLKHGVEEFLSMLPPSLLLKIRYNKDERIFQLDRMVLYRVNRKRKMAPQRVSWHDLDCQATKRQKLIKLPDKLPITR